MLRGEEITTRCVLSIVMDREVHPAHLQMTQKKRYPPVHHQVQVDRVGLRLRLRSLAEAEQGHRRPVKRRKKSNGRMRSSHLFSRR